jgi:hypothetical protein
MNPIANPYPLLENCMTSPTITHLSPVYTADDTLLGQAICLYHQPDEEEINPALKLYATYLQVASIALGESFFIPTDFVTTATPAPVKLSLTMKQIQHETFSRRPTFIALGHGLHEVLPE